MKLKLTNTATSLKKMRDNNEEVPENSDEDMLASEMGTENFGYALFDGGYLKPENWVHKDDLKMVVDAVAIVEVFKNTVDALHHEF